MHAFLQFAGQAFGIKSIEQTTTSHENLAEVNNFFSSFDKHRDSKI